VQAAKLATLGELTTGIAHELNNPLNNIGLYIGNVLDQIELGTAERPYIQHELHNAMQQARKATEIISHLRTFGRATSFSRELVSINQIVERALSLLQEQLRLRQILVEKRLAAENPAVMGNAIQLEQVFINLLTNARDAVAHAPHKQISIISAAKADTVRVTFQDSGPGIPKGLEQRIFDPFFTTKEVGAGTGLGLSIAYGIIKEHHGTISVDNRPSAGAIFEILLPLSRPDDAPKEVTS
jgi:C4-dicarboxylate-specific signal transduction histidine kinase